MGRHIGSRNDGYFYRAGRGWYAAQTEPRLDANGEPVLDARGKPLSKQRFIALTDDSGKPLRSKSTPVAELKAALRRIVAEPDEDANEGPDCVTVLEVCDAYLAKVIGDGATKTYNDRADTLFDFCYGLPPRFRPREGKTPPQPSKGDRIHKGYGHLPVSRLLPLHVDQWLNAHKTWTGGRRSRVQARLQLWRRVRPA